MSLSDASCIFSFEFIRGETTQTGAKFAGKKKNQFGGQNEQKINQNGKQRTNRTNEERQLLPHARCSFVWVNPILARIGGIGGNDAQFFFKPKRATNELPGKFVPSLQSSSSSAFRTMTRAKNRKKENSVES
jgi:hypothetical protein